MSNIKISIKYLDVKENIIYALCDWLPYVFIINLERVDVIEKILCPEQMRIDGGLFSGIYIEDDNAVLVPANAKKVWIYNLIKKEWHGIDISEYINPNTDYKFVGGRLKNGKAILFGYNYKGILAIDVHSYEIKEILNDDDAMGGLYGITSVELDGNIYIPMRHREAVICIDTNTSKYRLLSFNNGSLIPNDGITYDGESFYILKNSGNVFLKANYDFSIIEEMKIDEYFNSTKNYFEGIEYFSGNIIFWGSTGSEYVYNCQDSQKSFFNMEPIWLVKSIDSSMVIVCKNDVVEILDSNMQVINKITVELTDKDIISFIDTTGYRGNMIVENNVFGLDLMLKLLV